jgi:hypothetical protein
MAICRYQSLSDSTNRDIMVIFPLGRFVVGRDFPRQFEAKHELDDWRIGFTPRRVGDVVCSSVHRCGAG